MKEKWALWARDQNAGCWLASRDWKQTRDWMRVGEREMAEWPVNTLYAEQAASQMTGQLLMTMYKLWPNG